MPDYQIFEAGDVVLQSGLTHRNARLAYKTYGTLNADKSNVIVYPTSYGATHTDLEWQIGPGRALDPTKYFIVIMNEFGNGLSSSPSNTPPPFDRARYPHFTMTDNVLVQQRLLPEVFGVERGSSSTASQWAGCRRFIGARCSRTGSKRSRRSVGRRGARRTISYSWKGARRR